MAPTITSPIEGYTGRSVFGSLTLDFQDGVAETKDEVSDGIRAYLDSRGYSFEADQAEAPEGDPDESWTNKQLDAYAAAKEIDLSGAGNKAAKLAKITEAKAQGDQEQKSGTPDEGSDDLIGDTDGTH